MGFGRNNRSNQTVTTQGTGLYRIGEVHEPATPVSLPDNIITGHNFTQILANHPDATLKIKISDDLNGTNRPWGYTEVDLATLIQLSAEGVPVSGLVHVHDNAWVGVGLVDADTGELSFAENNRQMAYCSSEIVAPVPMTAQLNYQDIGNTRIQWGVEITDGIVTLPAPFADTSYSVTATNTFPNAERSSQVIETTKTTTQFEIRAFGNNTASSTGSNWMAIGVKP